MPATMRHACRIQIARDLDNGPSYRSPPTAVTHNSIDTRQCAQRYAAATDLSTTGTSAYSRAGPRVSLKIWPARNVVILREQTAAEQVTASVWHAFREIAFWVNMTSIPKKKRNLLLLLWKKTCRS
jgi:hypothetical protein